MKKVVAICLSIVMMMGLFTGCGSSNGGNSDAKNAGDPIVMMTPAGAEYEVLAYMFEILLEQEGYEVDAQIGAIKGLDMLREMMISDEAGISLGYTGNGMYYMGEEGDEVWTDLQKGFERIRDYDAKENAVTWLNPCPANDTELLAVTKEFAEANGIKDMYDFAKYVNDGGELKMATPQYWVEYERGLPGLEKEYGFKVDESQMVIGEMQEKGVAEGTDGLNCTMVFTTSGTLNEYGLYVIEDPLSVPPVYAPAFVINTDILEKYPEIADINDSFMPTIDSETLTELNGKIDSQGMNSKDVAMEYLKGLGLIK